LLCGAILFLLTFPVVVVDSHYLFLHFLHSSWFASRKSGQCILDAIRESPVIVMNEYGIWPVKSASQMSKGDVVFVDMISCRHRKMLNLFCSLSNRIQGAKIGSEVISENRPVIIPGNSIPIWVILEKHLESNLCVSGKIGECEGDLGMIRRELMWVSGEIDPTLENEFAKFVWLLAIENGWFLDCNFRGFDRGSRKWSRHIAIMSH
jgi:hypothetical protein